jgi:hypothetical protein
MLVLGGHQEIGIYIAIVEDVRAGQEIAMSQVLLDGRSPDWVCTGLPVTQLRVDRFWSTVWG